MAELPAPLRDRCPSRLKTTRGHAFKITTAALAVLCGAVSLQAAADDTLVLRLKWWHQFQFAGFYAAQAKGYYAEEGLAVRIEEGRPSVSSIDAVLAGDAHFGINDSSIVLRRLQGRPLVACAAILQHAPDVILSREDRNIRTPSDLVNARIMLVGEQGQALLHAMLIGEGIPPGSAKIVPHTWSIDDLIAGRVDAMTAYASEEPLQMRLRGVEPAMLRSRDYGVDFYGDTLFTREDQTSDHPERTAAFIRASLRGWDYALKHPGEIADLILAMDGVQQRGVTRDSLLAEAEAMKPYILSDVVEIGHMNPGRWEKIARTFVEVGMAPKILPLDGFIFDAGADPHPIATRWVLRLGGIVAVLAALIGLWNLQMRRRVRRRTRELADEIAQRTRAEAGLRASEERFRLMFNGAGTGIAVLSTDGRFLQANPSYCATTGYTETELQNLRLNDLIHPEDRTACATLIEGLKNGPDTRFITEVRCLRKTGGFVWKRSSVSLVRPEEDRPGSIIVVAEDVSARYEAERELARVNRAQRLLGACNEALIRAESENGLLHDICNVAVEIGGYRMAWAGYALQDEARTIRPVTHAGMEDGYLSALSLSWDENAAGGQGPVGRTIRDGRTSLVADIETDGSFSFARDRARTRGYRGFICLPLAGELRTEGVLALYSAEILDISADEIKLLEQLAADLAFGLNILRTRAERQKTQEALITVARAVSASVGDEFFHHLTRSMVSALGADIGAVAMLDPANPTLCHTLSVVTGGKRAANFTYSLVGAPCENVAPNEPCIIPRDVQKLHPASKLMADLRVEAYVGHPLVTAEGRLVGIMAVLYHQPLDRTDYIASSLQILATRAASELDRQQVDSRLREQAELLDKAQDAIIVRDLDQRITYWNKSAQRLYGWSAKEALGRPIATLLYKDPAPFNEATCQVFTKGEWVGELHQIDKKGNPLIVECRWTLVRDDHGVPRAILAINTDITDKKKLEHQFLRAQRMESVGTLAGGIAHDLNNVLAPVIMAVDLLKLSESDPRKLSLLNTVAASARRGADMVGQVLSFARGMDGRRVEVHLRHIVNDVEKIVLETFPKNIRITTGIDAGLWSLTGDPTQLHQVIVNLCVNARDAMPDGGSLSINAGNVLIDDNYATFSLDARPGAYVLLRIEDTGHGIPATVIDKIFDPFFTTKEVGKGTGLGLSTTLAIVKSHGGFIQVHSEENRGTRFHIHLPARLAPPPATDAPADPADPLPRGDGQTILLIEDEASIRQVSQHILEAFGYRVLTAADGAAGVSLYSENRADIALVLIDMMMPVMDGPAAIHTLIAMNPGVRIIAASGIASNAATARAAGPCVKDFLPKPYSAGALIQSIYQALRTPGA
jgi:PAS domain S-box-containing protein